MFATTYPVIVASPYASWTQKADYIEACRTTRRPGEPTRYSPPHPLGATTTDVTTFKIGWAGWNENNLPAIMYQLWPCQAWKTFRDGRKPGPRRDPQGQVVYERWPRPGCQARIIRDFEILRGIDQISTEVPWWMIEMLFRLDPRLRWDDLDMLMEYTGKRIVQPKDQQRTERKKQRMFTNALNNLCSRGRAEWVMVSWREKSKSSTPNQKRDTVLAALSQAQTNANTTAGSTPGPNGTGNVVPLPPARRRVTRPRPIVSQASASTGSKRKRSAEDDNHQRDLNMNISMQSTSRKKPKQAKTVNYIVDTGSSTSGPNKRKFTPEDDETPEDPPRRDSTTVSIKHTKKKQKVTKGAEDSTSSSLHGLQRNSWPPMPAWGEVDRQLSSSFGRSLRATCGNAGAPLNDSFNGSGMYPPQSYPIQSDEARSFELDMSTYTNWGLVNSDSRYAGPIGPQSYQQQGPFDTYTQAEQTQRRPLTQDGITTMQQGYHFPGSAPQTAPSTFYLPANNVSFASQGVEDEYNSLYQRVAAGTGASSIHAPLNNTRASSGSSTHFPSPTDTQVPAASALALHPSPPVNVRVEVGWTGDYGTVGNTLPSVDHTPTDLPVANSTALAGAGLPQNNVEPHTSSEAQDMPSDLAEFGSWYESQFDTWFNKES